MQYSLDEVAAAARVTTRQVTELVATGIVPLTRGRVSQPDAIRLVRALTGKRGREADVPLHLLPRKRRKTGLSLAMSLLFHGALLGAILLITSLGFLNANYTDESVLKQTDAHLIFFMSPGPGGGGGGGGLKMLVQPPPAQRKAEVKKPDRSPVPPVRKVVPPPKPIPPKPPERTEPLPTEPPKVIPKIDPPKIEPPPPAIQAPVVPMPADNTERLGLPNNSKPTPTESNGSGTGGGIGSGAGTGLGEGQGSGIGPGSGGGTGGGPFAPGSGIEPPVLLREVKPLYTEEARKRALEGDVMLEIVVRQDGSVGNVRITRTLGGGLDQKAVDAVRQWRFGPARRRGAPVDVVVEVSVEFKLR